MASTRARLRIRVSIGVMLIALLTLGFILGSDVVKKPFEFITRPIARVGHSFARWIQKISNPFEDTNALRDQLADITSERDLLIRENSVLKTIIGEQEAIRNIASYLESLQEQGTTAHVIGKIGGTQQIILLDKGTDDGIKKGQAVITDQGVLVGTIESATNLTSRVTLLTDESQTIAAKIQNNEASPGVVRGEFGLSLIMELIPQTDTIEQGQFVVTSALEPIIPPNILIGTITSVETNEGEIFQRAHIAPSISADRIELVSVIISRDE